MKIKFSKRFVSLLLAVLIMITGIPFDQMGVVWANDLGDTWDGVSVQKPEEIGYEYQIDSAEELAWFAQEVNSGNDFDGKSIYITGNINLNKKDWFVIGNGTIEKPSEINADIMIENAVISGLEISDARAENKGLFGAVRLENITVNNLKIENANIVDTRTKYDGFLFGSLELKKDGNCTVNNSIFGGAVSGTSHCGAFAGNVEAINRNAVISITNSDMKMESTSYGYYIGHKVNSDCKGGMIGRYNSSANTKLILNGIQCDVDLAAYNESGYWQACAGGMIGVLSGSAKVYVYQCAVTGKILSSGYCGWSGGIVGRMEGCNTYRQSDCYVTAEITSWWNAYGYNYNAAGFIGGITGKKPTGFIRNSYYAGNSNTTVAFIAKDQLRDETQLKVYNSYYDLNKIVNRVFHSDYHCYEIDGTAVDCAAYTTAQMGVQGNYVGWDFDNVWVMGNEYPELRKSNFELPVDFGEDGSLDVVESEIVKIVRDYASQEIYDQWQEIYNSNLPYDIKFEKIIALASNYGITDPKEGLEYVIKSKSRRWAYRELTTDEMYVASQFLNWLDEGGHRALLAMDGLVFNGEIDDWLDVGTYIEGDYPGIGKYKDMLYSYMDSTSSELTLCNDLKLANEILKNVTDSGKMYAESLIGELNNFDKTIDLEKRKAIIQKLAELGVNNAGDGDPEMFCEYVLDENSGFGKFAKDMGMVNKVLKCTQMGITDIYELNYLDSKLKTYYQFHEMLDDIISAKGIVPNELWAAAKQVSKEINEGYWAKLKDIAKEFMGQSKITEEIKDQILKNKGISTVMSWIDLIKIEAWFMNQVVDIGSMTEKAAYVEGYAHLAKLYKMRLEESTENFLNNMTEENAWNFYYNYAMLYSLRYHGEKMYLDMCNLKGLAGNLLSYGYNVKKEAVDETLSLLQTSCKFDFGDDVDIPESLEYLSKLVIACPVNVKVIANDGTVISELKDGKLQDNSNKYGRFAVVYNYCTGDYEKVIYLADQNVKIEVSAVDDGLVKMQYAYKNENGETIVKSISNTPVLNGQVVQITPKTVENEDYINLISEGKSELVFLNKEDNSYVIAKKVTLSDDSVRLSVGDTKLLIVSVEPNGATGQDAVWISSDTNITTVRNGNIKGCKKGSAVVYCFLNGQTEPLICNVTVEEKIKNDSQGTDSNSQGGNSNSQGTNSGSQGANSGSQGTNGGSSTTEGNNTSDGENVTSPEIDSQDTEKTETYNIFIPSKKLAVGKRIKLALVNGQDAIDNSHVKWAVDNKKYATVNSQGVLICKKKGIGKTVVITANSEDGKNVLATVKIKIMKHVVTRVRIKTAQKKMKAGEQLRLQAIIETSGVGANEKLKWISSNSKYASVNSKGIVTAKIAGKGRTVTITAKATDGSAKKHSVKIRILSE